MNTLLLFSTIFIYSLNAVPLTTEENEKLQKTCGLGITLKKPNVHLRKSVQGEVLEANDLPYVAVTYTKQDNGKVMIAPATIISPRHLAVWNTIRLNTTNTRYYIKSAFHFTGAVQCVFDNLVMPLEQNIKFDYDFEYTKYPNADRTFAPNVERVIVINGCADIMKLNDDMLLIYELKDPVPETHTPVCISRDAEDWNLPDHFIIHGVNTDLVMSVAPLAPVPCTDKVEPPLSCAESVNRKQGLCTGDFGGGAVSSLQDRATLFGTYAIGNLNCTSDTRKAEPYKFVNVGYLTEQICEVTGICVPKYDMEKKKV